MATKNSRDVKLTLSVDTLGDDDIKKLQTSIASLAKEGGDAAPEFQRLADEVARIGQQAQAVEAFRQLSVETDQLAAKQIEAAAATAKLEAALRESQAAANEAGAAQRKIERDVLAARAALTLTGGELTKLNAEYRGSAKSSEAYTTELARLIDRKSQEKIALDQANAAMRESRRAASEAQAAEADLEKTYVRSKTALQGIEGAQRQNAAAVGAAATAARELGISTDNVVATQAQLLQSLNSVGTQADRTATNVRELAAQNARVAEANREMIESDRLLAIEQATLADVYRRGRQDLDAFVRAQRESEEAAEAAARATREQAAAAAEMAEHNRLWAIQQQTANELARRAADALDAEKRALREAEQAANVYAATKREQAAAEAQAAQAAEVAAQRIDNAFKTVGVRSVQDLNREIAEVRVAMATLASTAGVSGQQIAGAFAAGEARIKGLQREIREVSGSLTMADRAARLFSNSMGQIAAGNLVADGIGYMVEKVKEMGREFVGAIVGIDQMRRGLNAIYKDSLVTATQIAFVRDVGNQAGIAFGGLSKEFVKFSAAMTSARVPLDVSNALFKELVTASASLGLGAEETAGSLNALGQMASKGVVSMEELRQQLGDRLPGAFGLVAKGLGITEAELVKLVESGNLASRDLFPALTKALRTMRGETDGLVPTFERFKGALTELAQNAGDSGWTTLLTGGLKVLGGTLLTVLHGVSMLSEGLFSVGRAAIVFFETLRGNGATAMAWFNEESLKMQQRLENQKTTLDNLLQPQKAVADATRDAAAANTTLGQSVSQVLASTESLTRAEQLQAVAMALAGNTALDAGAKYVQFNLAAVNLLKTQEQQTAAYKKSAEAAKIEGDSLIQIARIRGEQVGILTASVEAAEKEQAALARVADSRKAELDILQLQREQIEANRVARKLSTEDVKLEVQEIDKKIIAAKGEVEQSKQAAEASRIETEQRKLSAQTYADNSKRVDEFRVAVRSATEALEMAERANRIGLVTDQEVMQAKERLAIAQRLYKDALEDSVLALQREASAKAANLQLESANYSARAQTADIMARTARLTGDNATAIYYELEAKRANIEVTRIRYELMRLEAQAELQALEIQKQLIPVNDQLRQQRIQEIETRMQLQRVKLAEAGAGDEVVRALERELVAMRNNQNQRDSGRGSIDADTASRERNAVAIGKQTKALQDQKLTSDGFKANADGSAAGSFNNTLVVKTAFDLVEKSRKNQLTAEDLPMAQEGFRQAQEAMTYIQNTQAGFASQLARSSSEGIYQGAKAALEKVQSLVDQKKRDENKAATTGAAGTNATAARGSATKTVNVVINGRSTPINVASDADAAAVVAMMRQLETAAGATY